jgi:hypothetical protein
MTESELVVENYCVRAPTWDDPLLLLNAYTLHAALEKLMRGFDHFRVHPTRRGRDRLSGNHMGCAFIAS